MSLPAPCPCCGHLTLDQGPGDYELCPVCFWEDDSGQLRYPMSPDGANGISLVDAQVAYQRNGAVISHFKRKVRRPLADEPLDEGWRPFDPALDWAEPALESDIWPVNRESLYYWRDTYWNGDQHRLPMPPRAQTNADRLRDRLRDEVPELGPTVVESERRWGRPPSAFELCGSAADLSLAAYRDGDLRLGLRIVSAVAPALEEGSPWHAPNCLVIGFLVNPGWDDPALQGHVDQWPVSVRDALRRQQAAVAEQAADDRRRRDLKENLWRTGRGEAVDRIVDRLHDLGGDVDDARTRLHRELTARIISDHQWLRHHPVDSIRIAWRYRAVQRPRRTLSWLRRPRFAG